MSLPPGWRPGGTRRSYESGQSWIYEVERDEPDGRIYALKRLKNPRRRERFIREVETMRRLRGEGLAALPEVIEAELESERPHFVMPWFDAGSLQDCVDSGKFRSEPVAGLRLLEKLAGVLERVHGLNVAHRDLKPANVLLDDDDLFLSDFGLCLAVDEVADRLTEHHEAVGSRFYIAPENESGINEDNDQRPADCYAYGKLLWSVLAGRDPPAREEQLDPRWRLDELLQDSRYASLALLQRRLLDADPRSRLCDWEQIKRELETARRRFEGEDLADNRLPNERALDAARRVAELADIRQTRGQIAASREASDWGGELLRAMTEAAGEVDRAVLRNLTESTRGALTIYPATDTYTLAEVIAGNPNIGRLLPEALDSSATNVNGGIGSPTTYTAYSQENLSELPPVYLAIYAPLVESSLWLIAIPFVRPTPAQGQPSLVPDALVPLAFEVVGPLPIQLEQTLSAAREFVERAGERFVQIMERYFEIVEVGSDPADPRAWEGSATGWTRTLPLPIPRSHHGAGLIEDAVVVFGGQTSSGAVASAARRRGRGDWEPVAPLGEARMLIAGATTDDGKVFALGGESSGGASARVERYDAQGDAWEIRQPLSTARADASAVAVGQFVYIAGGHAAGEPFTLFERYSALDDTWTTLEEMPTARRGHALVASDSGLYAIGGIVNSGGAYTAASDVYDIETGLWSPGPELPSSCAWAAAAADTDGSIYVLGGFGNGEYLREVIVLEPGSNTWRPIDSLRQPRANFAAIIGPGRVIQALGGSGRRQTLASVEFLALDSAEGASPP